jgi:hypothetical protein
VSKETYYSVKKDLIQCQERAFVVSHSTCVSSSSSSPAHSFELGPEDINNINNNINNNRCCPETGMYVSSSSSYACIFLQVLSGDGWSDLARSLFARDETDETSARRTDGNVAFFFVSYMLINSIMLLNVVVAVLLVPLCVCVCVCVCVYIYTYIHIYTHRTSSFRA